MYRPQWQQKSVSWYWLNSQVTHRHTFTGHHLLRYFRLFGVYYNVLLARRHQIYPDLGCDQGLFDTVVHCAW
jgi:hypothetical protein